LGPANEKGAVGAKLAELTAGYSGWHWFNDDNGVVPDPPAARRLHEVAIPTLVVVGERDLPDFHTIANTLAREIPGARKVEIAGVGHMSNMEDPQEFNRTVLDFLATT
jgi:pimeloyl-ACP methyl ester carboxylesterase